MRILLQDYTFQWCEQLYGSPNLRKYYLSNIGLDSAFLDIITSDNMLITRRRKVES
jgi:hypothetical protein